MERIRLADKTRKISLETRETEFRIGTENRGQFRLSPDYGLWIIVPGLLTPSLPGTISISVITREKHHSTLLFLVRLHR